MSGENIEVSVVMPVYNKENYLREALEVILKQTLRQLEIICVNDASTDHSLEILCEMARQDERIIILNHEKNQGAGPSRNEGLQKARGEYVCFMDADDIYKEDLFEKELDALRRNRADIAVVEIVNMYDGEEIPDIYYDGAELLEDCYSMKDCKENLLTKWRWLIGNKMYRREFVVKQKLEYQDIRAANDIYFYIMAFMTAEKIVHVGCETPMGYYRIGVGGQITSYRKATDVYMAFEKIYDEMQERNLWHSFYEYFYECFWGCIRGEWIRCKEDEINKESYMFLKQDGLERVGFRELAREQFRNQAVYDNLAKIYEMDYESLWFLNFDEILKRRGDRVEKVLKRLEKENKIIALWGAAYRGTVFLRHSMEKRWDIAAVIDSDVQKWGTKIEKWVVQKFDEAAGGVDAVIVLRNRFCKEIVQKIEEKRLTIEVINLEKILLEKYDE